MADGLDPIVRNCLAALADAVFPLAAWIQESDKYTPPTHQTKPLPWRGEFQTLSVESLKCIEFFEQSLEEDDEDKFVARFLEVAQAPLTHSALGEKMKAWRKARGLGVEDLRFAPQLSENLDFTAAGQPVTRAEFYDSGFKQLKNVFDLRQPVGPVEWSHVAKDLLDDKDKSVTGWDAAQSGVRSSAFVRAFVREILVILLGGKLDFAGRSDKRWNFALAIELGEHRRPGNAYTVHDTRQTVQQFRAKLTEVAQRPPK